MTTGRMLQVVVGLFLLVTGLIVLLLLLGADFDSEYLRRALVSIPGSFTGGEQRGTRLSACGLARTLLPGGIGDSVSCLWWNLGSFYIMPFVALFFAIKMSLSRR